MKKLLSIFMLSLIFALTGCNDDEELEENEIVNLEGSLSKIMEDIYDAADYDTSNLATAKVTHERHAYFFGTAEVEFTDGLASEPIAGGGHSVVLLRVDETVDLDKMKTSLEENVNRCKWVIVCVEEEQVKVDSIGDIVVIIMDEEAEKLLNAFQSLLVDD